VQAFSGMIGGLSCGFYKEAYVQECTQNIV